jgi:hypothetical protein
VPERALRPNHLDLVVKVLLTVLALVGLGWAALPAATPASGRRAQARRDAALFLDAVKSVWPRRAGALAPSFPPLPPGWVRRVGRRHVYVDALLPEGAVLRLAPRLAPLVSAGRVRGETLVSFLCGPLPEALPEGFPNRSVLVVLPPWRRGVLPPACTRSVDRRGAR